MTRKGSNALLVVSPVVPPVPSGQSMVLGRLLRDPPVPVYFATQDDSVGRRADTVILRQARFYGPGWLPALLRRPMSAVLTLHTLVHRTVELTRSARRLQVGTIIGCTGGATEVVAASLAAMILRRRFVAYLFDDPVYQFPAGPIRRFAALAERFWSRRVSAVIVPNEALAEVVNHRAGLTALIVRNPVPANALEQLPTSDARADLGDPVRLVYTGATYAAQADALANIVRAIGLVGTRMELHVYTSQTSNDLAGLGIDSPVVVRHDHVDGESCLATQRAADLLVLPLAFHSPYPEVIETSAPGKLGEYLASGRPLLVHAPARSWVADFVYEHDAGVVVGVDDPGAVASALVELCSDSALRQRLVRGARSVAGLFTEGEQRLAFWRALDLVDRGSDGSR